MHTRGGEREISRYRARECYWATCATFAVVRFEPEHRDEGELVISTTSTCLSPTTSARSIAFANASRRACDRIPFARLSLVARVRQAPLDLLESGLGRGQEGEGDGAEGRLQS